ncbi:MAG: hypothetical protein KatS3mg115_1407 [Candidatus Poribacteria bacterium]|nr:MAG: hypothetical protein KatS3mg115_1407 [Candidatus Poribacteria bacterium]
MRQPFRHLLSVLAVVGVVAGLGGCGATSPLAHLPPIQPLDAYEGDYADIIVDTSTTPAPTLELTQKGITVKVQYWRQAELDKKFYRGNMLSAFYSPRTWKQSERVDVFYITIINNTDRNLRVTLTDFYIEDDLKLRPDMPGNLYYALPWEENERRLLYRKGRTLDVSNGLEYAKQFTLEARLTALGREIPPGETAEGYVPFQSIKPNANRLEMHIPVEIAPATGIGRYEKVDFVFLWKFDRAVYEAQPASIRR